MAEKATIARPYAEAIFELATQQGALAAWADQLALIAMVANDALMAAVLANPKVPRDQALALFLDVCGERLGESAKNLVQLLIHNQRMVVINAIAILFNQMKATAEQTLDVQVTSAFSMDAAQRTLLASALHKQLGRKIHLNVMLDASLIGGAIIQAGDQVIDGSVRGKLHRIATTLLG